MQSYLKNRKCFGQSVSEVFAVAFTAMTLLPSQIAHAFTPIVSTAITVDASDKNAPVVMSANNGGPLGFSQADQSSAGTWNKFAQAHAHGGIGTLGAYAQSQYSGPVNDSANLGASAEASAAWEDLVTINATGMTGRVGMWQGTLEVDGYADVNLAISGTAPMSGDAYARFKINMNGLQIPAGMSCGEGSIEQACMQLNNTALGSGKNSTGPWYFSFSLPFTYGTPIDLVVGLEALASTPVCSGCSATALAQFGDTLLWGGTTSMLDANGNPISNFDISSASSFNYLQAAPTPTPLPAAWSMLGMGIGTLLITKRRSRRT